MDKKFRVWDDKTQKFSYFDIRNSFGHIPNDIPNSQIQQFVGLLDKNNKEIYEGDILGIPKKPYYKKQIIFDQILSIKDLFEFNHDESIREFYSDFEIVGNIFEN